MTHKNLSYDVYKIERVNDYGDSYEIMYNSCVCCLLYKKYNIKPEVGQTLEVYGSFGQTIQGICIDGKTAFFKGETSLENERQDWLRKRKKEEIEKFELNKNKLDEDYDSLPEVFKKRLDILRENNKNFRTEYEAYEMLCCLDAVKIANELKTVEEYNKFVELDYDEKLQKVKGLDEGHSGNSFGCACQLAYYYITDPKYIYKAHGALCPLVSCKNYGCYTSTKSRV